MSCLHRSDAIHAKTTMITQGSTKVRIVPITSYSGLEASTVAAIAPRKAARAGRLGAVEREKRLHI
jgi:hypothetical protein